MSEPLRNSAYHDILNESLRDYSQTTARMIEMMFAKPHQVQASTLLEGGIRTERNLYVSIFFTGLVYGEYILAMNEETAARILDLTTVNKQGAELQEVRQAIAESFSELQNMVVGKSIVSLHKVYQKLTMTAPRVYFGSVLYPRLLAGRADLVAGDSQIECYLYVDRMKLDIASSYKDALSKVIAAHSELKEAMRKLKDQQTLLVQSEKMAALGTMAGGIAHEINTPLSTITLLGNSLARIRIEDEMNRNKLIQGIDGIQSVVKKIATITNGMRDFAYGVRGAEPKRARVQDLLNDAATIFQHVAKPEDIPITWADVEPHLEVECRAPEMGQVLLALLTNSSEAVRTSAEKWIRVDVKEEGEFIAIRVSDSGSGIDPAIRKKIFDPFFTTKEFGSGPGLGLSVAKGIVDAHNGRIFIDERVKNTCLVIHLPKWA